MRGGGQSEGEGRRHAATRPHCHTRPCVCPPQECLGGGELFEHLLAKGPFKEDYALAIFAQARRAPLPAVSPRPRGA